jgi:hypothetical protein
VPLQVGFVVGAWAGAAGAVIAAAAKITAAIHSELRGCCSFFVINLLLKSPVGFVFPDVTLKG